MLHIITLLDIALWLVPHIEVQLSFLACSVWETRLRMVNCAFPARAFPFFTGRSPTCAHSLEADKSACARIIELSGELTTQWLVNPESLNRGSYVFRPLGGYKTTRESSFFGDSIPSVFWLLWLLLLLLHPTFLLFCSSASLFVLSFLCFPAPQPLPNPISFWRRRLKIPSCHSSGAPGSVN